MLCRGDPFNPFSSHCKIIFIRTVLYVFTVKLLSILNLLMYCGIPLFSLYVFSLFCICCAFAWGILAKANIPITPPRGLNLKYRISTIRSVQCHFSVLLMCLLLNSTSCKLISNIFREIILNCWLHAYVIGLEIYSAIKVCTQLAVILNKLPERKRKVI